MSPDEPESDALSLLKLIDRLEVGPPRIEPRRVVAPYTVWRGGKSETCELVYRFGEDVFGAPDAAEPDAGALNLASMMTAQVAVNYGLFCDEIVFHGVFDALDRDLLATMAAITARDIYVRKLLRPKPFFTSWVEQIPIVRQESYLLARLRFPDDVPAAAPAWKVDATQVALLSSGGKDSLLSHQLLHECGRETHPIFLNESGKHWLTARSAYRHYAAEVANTARVWTSSDRVFSFMLRQLPFVKPRSSRYGMNGYPIQIWTVPIFLFGALPLLRRRGVGCLTVGNEYDTTTRETFEEIPHHFCLYDQSREFDLRLSDYFRRKGWGVRVFSLLRPLSGLLIQKLLLERYPRIQRLQTSCHRVHAEGGRMLPCGTCEKCLGVMAVLVAFGGDPTVCGYTRAQVERCLHELPRRAPWQELIALEHLAFLLHEQGLLPAAVVGSNAAARHPEVMKLRFDGDASARDDLPEDLRRPLFKLLLDGAEGAVELIDGEWKDFDLLGEEGGGCTDRGSRST